MVKQPVLIPNNHGDLKVQSREAAKILTNAKLVEMPALDRNIFDIHVPELVAVIRPFLDQA